MTGGWPMGLLQFVLCAAIVSFTALFVLCAQKRMWDGCATSGLVGTLALGASVALAYSPPMVAP